jgi:hypothetical protein
MAPSTSFEIPRARDPKIETGHELTSLLSSAFAHLRMLSEQNCSVKVFKIEHPAYTHALKISHGALRRGALLPLGIVDQKLDAPPLHRHPDAVAVAHEPERQLLKSDPV